MFRGLSSINVDSKGRFAIPTRYRAILDEQKTNSLIVTIDTSSLCILLYTLAQWELIEEKLQHLPSFDAEVRRTQRLLIGHATELELDSNGRLLIPSVLREYAQIDKIINLVGQGNKFEIWSEQLWMQHRESWLLESKLPNKEIHEGLRSLAI